MFESDVEKLATASENKIKLMNRFPPGYLALSALAGVYLEFGIFFIFFCGSSTFSNSIRPFHEIDHGVEFWGGLKSGYICRFRIIYR